MVSKNWEIRPERVIGYQLAIGLTSEKEEAAALSWHSLRLPTKPVSEQEALIRVA